MMPTKPTPKLALGLIALCLTPWLASCAKPCPPARAMSPPAVFLQAVPEPEMRGKTNAALADWALELRTALRLANEDKKSLRAWAEGKK